MLFLKAGLLGLLKIGRGSRSWNPWSSDFFCFNNIRLDTFPYIQLLLNSTYYNVVRSNVHRLVVSVTLPRGGTDRLGNRGCETSDPCEAAHSDQDLHSHVMDTYVHAWYIQEYTHLRRAVLRASEIIGGWTAPCD